MSLPDWPATVAYAVQQGSWKVQQRHNPNLRTEMNAGTTRRRRKYTLRVAKMTFDIVMNAAQRALFEEFYDDDLGDGAARFTMPVWDGDAYVTRTCTFNAPPQYSEYAHLTVRVSFDLMVEEL
jgi:hypothetical protein